MGSTAAQGQGMCFSSAVQQLGKLLELARASPVQEVQVLV